MIKPTKYISSFLRYASASPPDLFLFPHILGFVVACQMQAGKFINNSFSTTIEKQLIQPFLCDTADWPFEYALSGALLIRAQIGRLSEPKEKGPCASIWSTQVT